MVTIYNLPQRVLKEATFTAQAVPNKSRATSIQQVLNGLFKSDQSELENYIRHSGVDKQNNTHSISSEHSICET